MSNIFKRALSYFANSLDTQTTVVGNRHNYMNQKRQSVLTGGKFDFSQPELCSTVFASVQLITNNISKLKLNVYKQTDKGKEIHHNHPWQPVLAYSPDGRLSTEKWLNLSTNNLLLNGGVYYYISEYTEDLKLQNQLQALPFEIEAVVRYQNEVYYRFKKLNSWIESKKIVFPSIFSKDGITPISPISAIRHELEIQHGSEQTVKNFYQNNLFQILYLEADLEGVGIPGKKTVQEYFDDLKNQLHGSENAYNEILRVPPMYKLKSIPTPDLKFLESSRFTEARIASIFNIPPHFLNIESSTLAVKIEVNQLNFLNNCLSPIANIFIAELNHKLLTIEERQAGISIDFDYDNLFTLDLETKTIYLKNLSSTGAITPNEIRKKFGWKKDDSPFMDMNWIQSQNQPIQNYGNWQKQTAPVQPSSDNNNK